MLRSWRSRSRHGAQACAIMSAILLLASVSLLLSLTDPSPFKLRFRRPSSLPRFYLSLRFRRRRKRINYFNRRQNRRTRRCDRRRTKRLNEEEDNQGAEQEQQEANSNKASSFSVSSSGFYFDHVNGFIRRGFNKRSIDEWDYDYTGFRIGDGDDNLKEKSRGTPTEQQCLGVSSLRDWHVYPKWEQQDLTRALPSLSPQGDDLLTKMLKYNPTERISAKQHLITHILTVLTSLSSEAKRKLIAEFFFTFLVII